MSTKDELAKKYAKLILENGTGVYVANELKRELNSLTYTSTGQNIANEDKKEILLKTLNILIKGDFEYKEADNRNYLQLITHVIDQLEGNGD